METYILAESMMTFFVFFPGGFPARNPSTFKAMSETTAGRRFWNLRGQGQAPETQRWRDVNSGHVTEFRYRCFETYINMYININIYTLYLQKTNLESYTNIYK